MYGVYFIFSGVCKLTNKQTYALLLAGMGLLLATIWIHLGNKDTKINDRLSVLYQVLSFGTSESYMIVER